jgi:hypothetical protein
MTPIRKRNKLICGQGKNDSLVSIKGCQYYRKWSNMLHRVFGAKCHNYVDASVCEEWLTFSNFKSWMETQDWHGKELTPIDATYSPSTCRFGEHIYRPKRVKQ